MNIIEVKGLKKTFGNVNAVNDISFYVERGKLFSFLGPNGAGKSTTIDMICTFLKPNSGSVVVNGYTLGKQDNDIRSSIGAVFQDSLLDKLLTVEENLHCRGALYGLHGNALSQAVKTAIEAVGVGEYSKRLYGKLSGGQRRRCDIARALLHKPKILFLDEPTTGLDPQTRKIVWQTIQSLQKESGMTIFLTTHYMEEAANSDYVIVIDNGQIAAKGTPNTLRENFSSDKLKMTCSNLAAVTQALNDMELKFKNTADLVSLKIEKSLDALVIIQKCQQFISSFEVTHGTMDDAFINITGKELKQ